VKRYQGSGLDKIIESNNSNPFNSLKAEMSKDRIILIMGPVYHTHDITYQISSHKAIERIAPG
jgi:hypothetical protein